MGGQIIEGKGDYRSGHGHALSSDAPWGSYRKANQKTYQGRTESHVHSLGHGHTQHDSEMKVSLALTLKLQSIDPSFGIHTRKFVPNCLFDEVLATGMELPTKFTATIRTGII